MILETCISVEKDVISVHSTLACPDARMALLISRRRSHNVCLCPSHASKPILTFEQHSQPQSLQKRIVQFRQSQPSTDYDDNVKLLTEMFHDTIKISTYALTSTLVKETRRSIIFGKYFLPGARDAVDQVFRNLIGESATDARLLLRPLSLILMIWMVLVGL